VAVRICDADADFADIDYIHGVTGIAVAENRRRLRIIVNGQIFTQLGRRFGIERGE
jgi:hypothetical protein